MYVCICVWVGMWVCWYVGGGWVCIPSPLTSKGLNPFVLLIDHLLRGTGTSEGDGSIL